MEKRHMTAKQHSPVRASAPQQSSCDGGEWYTDPLMSIRKQTESSMV
jgi:hypothetical protein